MCAKRALDYSGASRLLHPLNFNKSIYTFGLTQIHIQTHTHPLPDYEPDRTTVYEAGAQYVRILCLKYSSIL